MIHTLLSRISEMDYWNDLVLSVLTLNTMPSSFESVSFYTETCCAMGNGPKSDQFSPMQK